jgi:hypothetical protein
MTDRQALAFIRKYFDDLFVKRDPQTLDVYLHPDYADDDIGAGTADHWGNAKRFLEDLFRRKPTIAVTVHKAMINNDVISADLEWFERPGGIKRTWMKGIGIFTLKGRRILRRHTFIYFTTDRP